MDFDELAVKIKSALSENQQVIWATDVDGTIASYSDFPDETEVESLANESLKNLESKGVRIAIVSGRPLSFLLSRFPDSFDLYGTFGVEHREQDKISMAQAAIEWESKCESFMERFHKCADQNELAISIQAREAGKVDGVYLQIKPGIRGFFGTSALAANSDSDVMSRLRNAFECSAFESLGLATHMSVDHMEIGPPEVVRGEYFNKSNVLRNLQSQSDFLIFAGDDESDAEAMRVVKQVGGLAVTVNNRGDNLRLPTPSSLVELGDIVLSNPSEMGEKLAELVDSL